VSETAPRRYLFSQFANASLVLLVPTNCRSKTKFLFQEREKRKMGGYSLGSAFDSKSEQMIMVALLLMVGSFTLALVLETTMLPFMSLNSLPLPIPLHLTACSFSLL
jgi:hypothetical protein